MQIRQGLDVTAAGKEGVVVSFNQGSDLVNVRFKDSDIEEFRIKDLLALSVTSPFNKLTYDAPKYEVLIPMIILLKDYWHIAFGIIVSMIIVIAAIWPESQFSVTSFKVSPSMITQGQNNGRTNVNITFKYKNSKRGISKIEATVFATDKQKKGMAILTAFDDKGVSLASLPEQNPKNESGMGVVNIPVDTTIPRAEVVKFDIYDGTGTNPEVQYHKLIIRPSNATKK